MRKIYKLAKKMNNARIIIEGKTGNEVEYNFTKGNVITNTPARLALSNRYDQDLLESSPLFADGTIILERVFETEEDKQESVSKDNLKVEEDIKTVTEAIAYVAENFGEKATTARNALNIAEKNGVTFPNLKLGKK